MAASSHGGVGGERVDRVQSDDLDTACTTGWESLPPQGIVMKRSAVDRVAGLSANAKRWGVMVHKGRERAAAPVNSQKKKRKGTQAIHSASAAGHIEVVQWLVSRGAAVGACDNNGVQAIHNASNGGHMEVVQWCNPDNIIVLRLRSNFIC